MEARGTHVGTRSQHPRAPMFAISTLPPAGCKQLSDLLPPGLRNIAMDAVTLFIPSHPPRNPLEGNLICLPTKNFH